MSWHHSIYVAMNDSGRIKLGCSRDPVARVAGLNREEKRKRGRHAQKIFLKFSHEVERDAYAVERAAHRHLAPYQVEDEWFDIELSHAEGVIMAAADMVAVGIDPGRPRLKGRGGDNRRGKRVGGRGNDERDERILARLRAGETNAAVGRELGLTRERIRQIAKAASGAS